jgi:CheY-like chemotaxis protein
MTMKILILEDNQDRRTAMQECLADRLYSYESVFFSAPQPMLCYLREHLREAICISLDHDMDIVEDAEGRRMDPGTGREIADYLVTQSPQCPVVIHSTNTIAAESMEAALKESGWTVYRVAPWGDLAWVRAAWFRTVRRAIVDAAVPAPPPSHAAGDQAIALPESGST